MSRFSGTFIPIGECRDREKGVEGTTVYGKCMRRTAMRLYTPEPKAKKGIKYIDCPLYGDCLMGAAKSNLLAWSCDKCPNLKLKGVRQRIRYIAPYYQLLAEVYPEFRRKYEPVMNSFLNND